MLWSLLTKLDLLIAERELHCGEELSPVCVEPLLEEAIIYYQWLPAPVLGISVQWDGDAGVTFNRELLEPERSDDRRHAYAHEFGHIFLKHRGYFIVWRAEEGEMLTLDRFVRNKQERECNVVAAYLLVRRAALKALQDMDASYVAATLDVPESLVQMRWDIWQRSGR